MFTALRTVVERIGNLIGFKRPAPVIEPEPIDYVSAIGEWVNVLIESKIAEQATVTEQLVAMQTAKAVGHSYSIEARF